MKSTTFAIFLAHSPLLFMITFSGDP